MTYLIIGVGGIGGAIGGYLAASGRDTSFATRGAMLQALREKGLELHSGRQGLICLPSVNAYAPGEPLPKADIIFVCVKGYSLAEVIPAIARASREDTLIIPILNSMNAGDKLAAALPGRHVLDGLIYTSSFVEKPGVIANPVPTFRIVCGPSKARPVPHELLAPLEKDVNAAGIELVIPADMQREVFKKYTFISAAAATDTMFDVPFSEIHKPGEYRDFFVALTQEIAAVAAALGVDRSETLPAHALKALDNSAPGVTTSMHKDSVAGKRLETQELIFDVVELAAKLGVPVPAYEKAAAHFR